MNKTELKKLLKPMIKECIREVIFEESFMAAYWRLSQKSIHNFVTGKAPCRNSGIEIGGLSAWIKFVFAADRFT